MRVAIGYICAVGIAIPLGLIIGWSKKAESFSEVVIATIRLIPPVAWIPFAMLWFGMGDTACIYIIVVSAFFPTLLNTVLGVKQVDLNLIQAAKPKKRFHRLP